MLCWCSGALRAAAGCARESITRSVGVEVGVGADTADADNVASSSYMNRL
jgi:hypothetical protein